MEEQHKQLKFVLCCIIVLLSVCSVYSLTHRICRIIAHFNHMDLLSILCTIATVAASAMEYFKIIRKKKHPDLTLVTVSLAAFVFVCSLIEFGSQTRERDEATRAATTNEAQETDSLPTRLTDIEAQSTDIKVGATKRLPYFVCGRKSKRERKDNAKDDDVAESSSSATKTKAKGGKFSKMLNKLRPTFGGKLKAALAGGKLKAALAGGGSSSDDIV